MSERLERWRLVLGQEADKDLGVPLTGDLVAMDRTLSALYDGDRKGGLGASSPNVSRWLGDIRTYFPSSVVKVMQQDALTRLNLTQMLLEPELLEQAEPDVHLIASLLSLRGVIPARTKETARVVVRKVVRSWPSSNDACEAPCSKPCAGRCSARSACPVPARTRSTGTARSARTCATTARSTAP